MFYHRSKFGSCDLESSKISKSNVLTGIKQVMSSTAFGKIIAVYGHIDENGRFVRKWTVPKMAITDKMVKNSCLSVKNSGVSDLVLRTNASKSRLCP